jgi:hypothetical protein
MLLFYAVPWQCPNGGTYGGDLLGLRPRSTPSKPSSGYEEILSWFDEVLKKRKGADPSVESGGVPSTQRTPIDPLPESLKDEPDLNAKVRSQVVSTFGCLHE